MTHRGKPFSLPRLEKGQRVEVTYIPTGRYPTAVAIDVVGEPKASGRSAARIRVGPDGNAETTRPEDNLEQSKRSNHDDPGSQDRRR